jgi:hypothetical protein
MGYQLTIPTEYLVWESDECTKDEWELLCKIFGQDILYTVAIKVEVNKIESYQSQDLVTDFCTKESSVFSIFKELK